MIFEIPGANNKLVQLIVPILVILGLGYYDFVSCYSLGYQQIYKYHSHGVAISLWVLVGFIEVTLFLYWILIFIIGPGKAPKLAPFDIYNEHSQDLTTLPDIFLCDKFGYPYYNSHTDSLTIPRSFYSKHTEYMVLKYDHYCLWIGSVIGENNYLFFMKFMIWFFLLFFVPLIYLIRYVPSQISREGEINHNFIPMFIFCGFWLIMIGALFGVHFKYVCINMTTFDEITMTQKKIYRRWKYNSESYKKSHRKPRKENGKRFVNIKKDNLRLVVQFDIEDHPYNMGFKKNWINLVFNGNRNHGLDSEFYTGNKLAYTFLILLIPFVDIPIAFKNRTTIASIEQVDPESRYSEYKRNSSTINPDFLQSLYRKIEYKDCYLAQYLSPEILATYTNHRSKVEVSDDDDNYNEPKAAPSSDKNSPSTKTTVSDDPI
ncbi:DHHC palmitoyltransferase-domain-containing protein [Scheffersomyces amazonensis]|uniref:DHHC palmitoyltransferase-domain-containing protein n=1 Tax=Scheffersomyces amazonensis TaxID=1078765 RepID=UPI00315DA33D